MSKTCKRRFLSSTGIAIVAILAIGIAWNSLSVPTAKAVAGDGASGNIALLDTNANGKIDRITMNIANPNNATEPMTVYGTFANCLSVTYGGTPVTISGTPTMAVSHPSVLTINLDETSVVVNTDGVNTASQFEVVYSQGANGIGVCIDDTDAEYLNDIATGDSGVTDTEADLAAPVIVSSVYQDSGTANGTVDKIVTTWSEDVTQTGAGANDYTIGGGAITAAFSASADDVGGNTTIDITVTATANKTGASGGAEPTILYVAGLGDPVHDESLATNIAVANGAGAITVTDDAAPMIISAVYQDSGTVNGTVDRIATTWSENVSQTSAGADDYTIVGGDITAVFSSSANDGNGDAVIYITVTADAGETGVNGGTEPTINYIAGVGDPVQDVASPVNVAVASPTVVTVTDNAAPVIYYADYYDADLDGKIDRITLTFTETLDATSTLGQDELTLGVGDFTGATFDGTSTELVGAVSTVDIDITESTEVDTYSTSAMTLSTVAGFSLTDGTNPYTTTGAQGMVTFRDYAKPVIKTVTPTDASTAQSRTNSVVYTFSEPMVGDTWVEGTEFDSSPDGSGWSGTWSGTGNLTMTLTHSPFLCVQTYTESFTPAQITATNGATSPSNYKLLNIASTAPIGATHTFTTMSCSSSGSSSSSGTTEEEDEEEVVAEEEEEEVVADEETTTEEEEEEVTSPSTGEQGYSPVTGELEDVSVVTAGDFIKSPYFSTVYYVTDELVRRPFMDSQTFFTYADSFNEVSIVTDATLATLDLGSVMLPNPGVVLVKIQSDPKTYAIDEVNALRWITTEAVATSLYGNNWADYIIDIEPTFFTKFGTGTSVTAASDVTVSDEMKTRTELAE